ncbi:MAG: tRNA modification GTPase, partial [Phycisphaerales bacterium]|nr:tRNA modification GTPase [Phycisphaerales bacterium]
MNAPALSDGHGDGANTPARNVAVLLTPAGSGAIAVIRLSGPSNAAFIAKHFTGTPREGRCAYGDLRDGDEVIDDIVVVQTATAALDLNAHGGPWVTQAVLNLAERAGYTIEPWRAAAGISLDAADEIERQMLLDLPAVKSKAVLQLLTAQPAAWRAMLESNDQRAMQAAIDDKALETALAVPAVAIVGPPNVGKSTLANALFGQARSITADVPGTTRDWIGELADIDGLVVKLIDTPGVRETSDAIEAEAIARAGHVFHAADMVIVAIDGSVPLSAADQDQVRNWVARSGTPGRVTASKKDTVWSTRPCHPDRSL